MGSPLSAGGLPQKASFSPKGAFSPKAGIDGLARSPQGREEKKIISVDLQALEADVQQDKLLVELRKENKDLWSQCNDLQIRVVEAEAETSAAFQLKAAAEAAKTAAEQEAASSRRSSE